jgi:DNA-binding NarL/FixJ family response regulator
MHSRPTVILADDHTRILTVASMLLVGEFEIVAAVSDGATAVEAAAKLKPDVVILDIGMPGTGGIQAACQLKERGLTPRVIFLTVQDDADYVDAACAMGASYVLKPRMYSDLLTAIKEALEGRSFFSIPLRPHESANPI